MNEKSHILPLVSIIVITYKHEPYIKECVESLALQETNFPYEILIGEDCSPDNTRKILLELQKRFPEKIVLFLQETNVGAKKNAQNLLARAKGKYLAYCEGDDFWHRKDKLQKQINLLENDPGIALVCTDCDVLFQKTGKTIRSIHERIGQWYIKHEDITKALVTRKINIFTCTVCFRADYHRKIRSEYSSEFSEEIPMGDIQTWIRLSTFGKVVPIRESCATYRILGESASRSANNDKMFAFHMAALSLTENYVQEFGYDKKTIDLARMQHIWPIIDMAVMETEDTTRKKMIPVLQQYQILGNTIFERYLIKKIKSGDKMCFLRKIYPSLKKGLTLQSKIKNRTIKGLIQLKSKTPL